MVRLLKLHPDVSWVCPKCSALGCPPGICPLDLLDPFPWDGIHSAGFYRGHWKKVIKEQKKTRWDIQQEIQWMDQWVTLFESKVIPRSGNELNVLFPVPSRSRFRKLGSRTLCERMAFSGASILKGKGFSARVICSHVEAKGESLPPFHKQAQKSWENRFDGTWRRVLGKIRWEGRLPKRGEKIRIWVLDDVMTTGETLRSFTEHINREFPSPEKPLVLLLGRAI